MNKCDEIRELLSPFIEGEVTPSQREVVERHLETCSGCRSDLALLRYTIGALKDLPDLHPPPSLLEQIRKEVSPAPARSIWRRFFGEGAWVGVPLGAFAMVMLGIAAFVIQERFPGLPEGPDPSAPRQTTAPVEKRADIPTDAETPPAGQRATPAETAHQPVEPPPAAPEDSIGDSARPRAPSAPKSSGPLPLVPPADDTAGAGGPTGVPKPTPDAPSEEERPVTSIGAEDTFLKDVKPLERAEAPSDRAAPAAPSSPPPPAKEDFYRETGPESAGMKDVRRLLESNEILLPARRDNGNSSLAAEEGAVSRPSGSVGIRAALPDAIGTAEKGDTDTDRTGEVSRKKSLERKTAPEASPAQKEYQEAPARTALRGESARAFTGEEQETLTLLIERAEEIELLRRSIKAAGGQLLELKSLDEPASRALARPYRAGIPASQVIRRGWRIRALLPADKTAAFIASVEREPRQRLLGRSQAPAVPRSAPGIQSLEINVIY